MYFNELMIILFHRLDFTMRKHSMKKHEQEINVTAPLWTDAPGIKYDFSEAPQRTSSLKTPQKNEATGSGKSHSDDTSIKRPVSLDFEQRVNPEVLKSPPVKLPRTSKGANSPLSPRQQSHQRTNEFVFETNDCDGNKENLVKQNNELQIPPPTLSMNTSGSSNSISSQLSEVKY